ncbi:MAG: tRNA dihydrouridine synthase DusB [Verrucomicrobiae bacterium]|nr:tRNA dihydrouridine synthase DusB [Verrucomicrobiae bacterium]
MPFRIGSVTLSSNLCLAPLAGYTNLPFRRLIRELGGVGLCTTDLVNARSLLEGRAKALELIASAPWDRPLAVQLYGSNPAELAAAAQRLADRGVDIVDLNMGCPVRKVCRTGSGAALLRDVQRAADLVYQVVQAVRIPVTCKMRLGWDDTHITAPELARAFEQAGVAAITIHGRTRQQGFTGTVNLDGIRAVVQAVRAIPIIGNGDVTTPQAAKTMFDRTGCAAVSIGRGAFYNPWIFQQTQHYLETGELLPEPTLEDRLTVMTRHLDYMIEFFGEARACRMFRKIALQYATRFGPAAEFRRRIVTLERRDQLPEILDAYRHWRAQFLDEAGNLLPAYAPRPFAAHPAIPVPAGPVERW